MSSLLTGLALALAASALLNASYLLQHSGSAAAPAVNIRRPLASVRGLLLSRVWVAGLVLGVSGWALHVGALARAPLSLVQAFAAGGLALAVPAAARMLDERLSRAESAAIALMVVALGLLGLGAGASPSVGFSAVALVGYLVAMSLLAALLAARSHGSRRPHALGAAAGILYGVGDTATKAVTAGHGLVAWLASPWLLVLIAASIGAFFAFQRGLQTGAAVPVIALMTVATNIVAVIAGVTVFGEGLGATPLLATAHLLAFALVGAAAWLLARAQARLAISGASPAAPVAVPQ